MVHHARPEVSDHPLAATAAEAQRLGVDKARLDRLLKLMTLATNPGTAAEGAAATRALNREIAALNISKVDADALLRPASEAELLKESGNFVMTLKLKRLPLWLDFLVGAVADLMGCKHYWSREGDMLTIGMYGEHSMAATAAHLFADVYVQLWNMSDAYTPENGGNARVARGDYRMAMVDGYIALCDSVGRARKEAVERYERSQAAKQEAHEEARQKKRLRLQAAREELRRSEADASDGEEAETWEPPPMHSAPVTDGHDSSDEDDVVLVEVVDVCEREKRKAAAAFASGEGIVLSDDEDDDATLVLSLKRNELIKTAAAKALDLGKAPRARKIVIRDAKAWRAGKADAKKLPTARTIGV